MVGICGHGSAEIQVYQWTSNKKAPNVLFTSTGTSHRTERHGGWSRDGITLYNSLIEELAINRKDLHDKIVNVGNDVKKTEWRSWRKSFLLGKMVGP